MVYTGQWREVESLDQLRDQQNALAPRRSRASDGSIADAAHSTTSKHYPTRYAALGSVPVTLARDLTHDPAGGADQAVWAEQIRVSRDSRINIVIFNRRMYSSYPITVSGRFYPAWAWRPYSGSNPHDHHAHYEVKPTTEADSRRPWAISNGIIEEASMGFEEIHAIQLNNQEHWRQACDNLAEEYQVHVWQPGNTYPLRTTRNRLVTAIKELQARPQAAVEVTPEMLRTALQDPQVLTALAGAVVQAMGDPQVRALIEQEAFDGAQRAERE